MNHASALVAGIASFNQLIEYFSGGTKSIMNSEGKLNFITAMIDGSNPLTFQYALQGETAIDNGNAINDTTLDMGAFNSNPYLASIISAGAPIFQSSTGGIGYYDGSVMQNVLNDAENDNGLYQGDFMYIFLKGSSQYIGACVEYFDNVA